MRRKPPNRVSLSELKSRLSEIARFVKKGGFVIILDRGRPVARISPLSPAECWEGILDTLARSGVVKPPKANLPDSFFTALRN